MSEVTVIARARVKAGLEHELELMQTIAPLLDGPAEISVMREV